MFDDDARNADRSAADGPMGVSRMPDDTIAIEVEHDGEKQSLRCSEYNALHRARTSERKEDG